MPRKIDAWHFVKESRTLRFDEPLEIEAGYIYSIGTNETVDLCRVGMHASRRAIDALYYAPGPMVCRVRVWGDVVELDDKLAGRHREVVWMADATQVLRRFACWCVRNTPLGDGRTTWDLLTDPRSRAAVEAKERWLDAKVNGLELKDAIEAAKKASKAAWNAWFGLFYGSSASLEEVWMAKAALEAASLEPNIVMTVSDIAAASRAADKRAYEAQNAQLEMMLADLEEESERWNKN